MPSQPWCSVAGMDLCGTFPSGGYLLVLLDDYFDIGRSQIISFQTLIPYSQSLTYSRNMNLARLAQSFMQTYTHSIRTHSAQGTERKKSWSKYMLNYRATTQLTIEIALFILHVNPCGEL